MVLQEMLDLIGEGNLKRRIAQMPHANKLTLALRFGCAEVPMQNLDSILVARICDAAATSDSSRNSEADKDKDGELQQLRTMVVHLQDRLEVVNLQNRKIARELDHYRKETMPTITFQQNTEPHLAAEDVRQAQREETKMSTLYRAFKFLSGSYQTTSTEHADRAAAHNLERQTVESRPKSKIDGPVWELQDNEEQSLRRTNDWVASQAQSLSLDYGNCPKDYEEAIKDLITQSESSAEVEMAAEEETAFRSSKRPLSNSKHNKDLEEFISEAPKIQYRENPVNKVARAAWKTSAFASSVPVNNDFVPSGYTGLIGQILGTSPATAKGREAEKVVEFDD